MNVQNKTNTPHNPLEGERPEMSVNLDVSSDEKVSIVIVHKDTPEYLNMALQSISICSMNSNYEIIVVDNGSGPESQAYLDELEKQGSIKEIVRNEKNEYWSAAANKAAERISPSSSYVVFMHSDVVILNPSWLDILINVCESRQCGMVGIELQSYKIANQPVQFVQEWMIMLSRKCWKDVGPWPVELPQVGPSFVLTLRANNKGYKPQIIKNQLAHHYQVFNFNINDYEQLTTEAMVTLPKMIREESTYQLNK